MVKKDPIPDEDKVYSEFSMGLFDFKRLDMLLCHIDEFGFKVRLEPHKYVKPYFSVLKQLYINLRPMLFDGKKKEYDDTLKELYLEIFRRKQISSTVVTTLEEFNVSLIETRQDIGLGLSTATKKSEKRRADNVWGG